MVKNKKQKNKGKDDKTKLSPKEKIIKHLIEYKEPTSILSLSGSVVLDYKNTYNIVNDFYPEIISKEKIGNTNLVKLNFVPNQEIYSVEQKRTQEFLQKNSKIKIIKDYIEEINYPFMIVLVFGSYAKNRNIPASDIDICIISDNEEKKRKLFSRLNLLSLKLEIQEFTTDDFISMIEKSQRNLGHEIIKSNIILYGIENYYNLISKWMKKE